MEPGCTEDHFPGDWSPRPGRRLRYLRPQPHQEDAGLPSGLVLSVPEAERGVGPNCLSRTARPGSAG